MKNQTAQKVALTGLMAALSYVVFTFLQFKIMLPGGDATSIHLGNAVCVLGALLLGGFYGGLGGAIGMTIGDLLDPVYIVYAPKTFILKLCIGLITGLIAHKLGKITIEKDNKKVLIWTILAAVGGLLFNVIFDPLVGYFYKTYLFGIPQEMAKVLAKMSSITTLVNGVVAVICASLLYLALRPAITRARLMPKI